MKIKEGQTPQFSATDPTTLKTQAERWIAKELSVLRSKGGYSLVQIIQAKVRVSPEALVPQVAFQVQFRDIHFLADGSLDANTVAIYSKWVWSRELYPRFAVDFLAQDSKAGWAIETQNGLVPIHVVDKRPFANGQTHVFFIEHQTGTTENSDATPVQIYMVDARVLRRFDLNQEGKHSWKEISEKYRTLKQSLGPLVPEALEFGPLLRFPVGLNQTQRVDYMKLVIHRRWEGLSELSATAIRDSNAEGLLPFGILEL